MTWLRFMFLAALAARLVGIAVAADPAAANPEGAGGSATLPPVLRASEPPDSVLITLPGPPPLPPPLKTIAPLPPRHARPEDDRAPPARRPARSVAPEPGPGCHPSPASFPAGRRRRPGQAVAQPGNRARGSRLLPKADRTLERKRRQQKDRK